MNKEIPLIEITEESIESMVYEIRGQRVMLDLDLARIYGYTTRDFNNQIKHNIERFDNDFRFQITKNEVEEISRWKKSTAIIQTKGVKGGRTTLPYAFTEQGVYMLMTVLRGELAVKQSKALIRLFKNMKDYIVQSNNLLTTRDILELSNQVNRNSKDIESIKKKLTKVMDNFIDPSTYKRFLILDGQKIEADVAYQAIYSMANKTIAIVDDYIDIKTLHLLLCVKKDVNVVIYSDNVSRNHLQQENVDEFINQSGINLVIKPTYKRFHDRYIIIDHETENKKLYLSGSSSKDAGNKVTTIMEVDDVDICRTILDLLSAV